MIFFDEFREPEIANNHISIFVYEKVLWLEIAVNDVFLVEVVEGEDNLSHEELDYLLREALDDALVLEKLTTSDEAHEEVNPEVVLENELHINKEWMIDALHDFLF